MNQMSEPETNNVSSMIAKSRNIRSYQTDLMALQASVDVAITLLGTVKAEKGSVDVLAAVITVLKCAK